MRVAVVTPYLPWPADTGGKLRSYYLLRGLAQYHDVDLFTVHYGEEPSAGNLVDLCVSVTNLPLTAPTSRWRPILRLLTGTPRSVQFFQSEANLQTLRSRLAASYDLFVCDEICMAPYFEWPEIQGVPRLVIRHKIDYLHYLEVARARAWDRERVLTRLEALQLKRFEWQHMPGFQGAVACSPADAQVAGTEARGRIPVEVIVNGADTEYFVPERAPDPDPTLLLIGTMFYYPNIDATLYFFREMWPALHAELPNLKVLVVGHTPPPEIQELGQLPGVTVTGSVPDVRPYMSRAWALTVPLRLGGGTRLKIVEAMSAGLPVVSTSVGAEGIAATDGEHLLLADEPAVFVERTLQLLRDARMRRTLAECGRMHVEAYFSWQALGERYASFCEQVATRRRFRAPAGPVARS